MSNPLRLVFDDCLSKHAVSALQVLAGFSQGQVEFQHLVDFNLSGQRDDEWIPEIARLGAIIVTTDRGRNPSRGGKLPLLCRRHHVTHVMLSAAIHKRNTFDKLRAIFEVWPDLLEAAQAPAGTGFLLQDSGGKSHRVKLAQVVPQEK